MHNKFFSICFFSACLVASNANAQQANSKIDRFALVSRNNVIINDVDTLGSLSVGNGEFAFTVDVTGLQTFPDEYENGIPLGTQSQWAWHRIPAKEKYTLNDVARKFESCDGMQAPYPVQHNDGKAGDATRYLRSNPHRLHLGMVGLILLKENGEEVGLGDLKNVHQQLDLWTGKIESRYEVEGVPVQVTLYAHQKQDGIAVKVASPLIAKKRLRLKLRFPYGKDCHTCAGYDWGNEDKHKTDFLAVTEKQAVIRRQLDTTTYFANLTWSAAVLRKAGPHQAEITPSDKNEQFEFALLFSPREKAIPISFKETEKNSIEQWKEFWTHGGAVDFAACTDPRAKELERRVVLSQYLTRIQCAGTMPPQETGLTMNSWFGKFHLEMHWWHAAHFALWGRPQLLEKSMEWYYKVLPKAKATAQWQGYQGARWQKMTDPQGAESPSNIGAFIIWQQPHPIFLAELLYRQSATKATLEKYRELVFNTADFMASFLKLKDGKYHLCHPLVPAQEIFEATKTDDPAYEIQYWCYALNVAQEWRTRSGMERNKKWDDMLRDLTPLSVVNNLYLPTATTPNAYTDDHFRNDHPAVLGAYGFLPYHERIDTAIMANTFSEIIKRWNWDTTWGWDYPLLAMTAARLHKPEQAIDILLMHVQKNTYLVNGHNYQDNRLRLYLPGNGGLLSAIALMAAGWDNQKKKNPGFPANGKWNIKWEGIKTSP